MSHNAGNSCEGSSAVEQALAPTQAGASLPPTHSAEWTSGEEASLTQALLLHTEDKYPSSLERCILIAAQLPTRSAREVALRIRLLAAQQARPHDLKRRSSTPAPAPAASRAAAGSRHSSRANGAKQAAPPSLPLLSLQALASSAPPPPSLELQEIPPPGPGPLLPSLSASCFYLSPSTSNTSSGEANCRIHLTTATTATTAADQGTSGSAETSFGDPSPSMAATHPSSGAAAATAATPEESLVSAMQALLEQNYSILNAFKANMQQCKVGENTELLVRFRDNISACLAHMSSEQQQCGSIAGSNSSNMPPLPAQPNLELANKFLPAKVGVSMGTMPPMPPFPFNPAMGPFPGMPLMFPPMGNPPGILPSMPQHMPFPMHGMTQMPGMTSAALPADVMPVGGPGQAHPGVPAAPHPIPWLPMTGPGGTMIPLEHCMAQPPAVTVKQEPS